MQTEKESKLFGWFLCMYICVFVVCFFLNEGFHNLIVQQT